MLRSFPFCWLLGGKASTTYLGLPLASTFKSPTVWDVVEERGCKRVGCLEPRLRKTISWLGVG